MQVEPSPVKVIFRSSNAPNTVELISPVSVESVKKFLNERYPLDADSRTIIDRTYFSVKISRNTRMTKTDSNVKKSETQPGLILDEITNRIKDMEYQLESMINDNSDDKTDDLFTFPLLTSVRDSAEQSYEFLYSVILYPSLSRCVLQTIRPTTNIPTKKNLFTVEIYNPYLHNKLYHEYLETARKENRALKHPRALITPQLDPTQLGPNITFIALKDGKIIGYAMFSIIFLVDKRSAGIYKLFNESRETYTNDIFQAIPPQNLFNIDSLSVLSAYNGHHVSLILLYHGIDFALQLKNTLTITHLVSFSGSIATKHNLVDHLGFEYFGRNIFINEDFSDTLDIRKRGNIQLILQEFARYLTSVVYVPKGSNPTISPLLEITREMVNIAIIIYQMAAIFNFRSSYILNLLIVFAVNYVNPSEDDKVLGIYLENNINLYVNSILQKDYKIENWRRESVVYLTPTNTNTGGNIDNSPTAHANLKIGLARPKTIDGAKAPIHYGYDQILYIYGYLSTLVIGTAVLPIFNVFTQNVLPDLNAIIGGTTSKYDINFYQLRSMNQLIGSGILGTFGVADSVSRETYIADMHEDLRNIARKYGTESIDTVTKFDSLSPYIASLRQSYQNGGTKNFIKINNDTQTDANEMIVDEVPLDYELNTDPVLLKVKIENIIQITENSTLNRNSNDLIEFSTKVYGNLNLFETTEYMNTLIHIYNIRTGSWDIYKKS